MKTYNVLSRVSYGKAEGEGDKRKIVVQPKDYEAGSTIELDDEDAAPLLKSGVIAPVEGKKK